MKSRAAVIIIHQAGFSGKRRCTDEGLFRSLESLYEQYGPQPTFACVMTGNVHDGAVAVWNKKAPGAALMYYPTVLGGLRGILETMNEQHVFLLSSGDVWDAEKLRVGNAALKRNEVFCHAMQIGMELDTVFFPGWDEARSLFKRTGLPLFHPRLSAMCFQLTALRTLLDNADESMPPQWELGSLLAVRPSGNMKFSTQKLGSVDVAVPAEKLGVKQIAHLRKIGCNSGFAWEWGTCFPALANIMMAREIIPTEEAQRFKVKAFQCVTEADIVHSPQNLLMLTILFELGPGRWEPLNEFLREHSGFIYEYHQAFAEIIVPGEEFIKPEDLMKFIRLGLEFWKDSKELRVFAIKSLRHWKRGHEAFILFQEANDCSTTAWLLFQCALQAGDKARADVLVDQMLGMLGRGMTLVDRRELVCSLAQSEKCAKVLPHLAEMRSLIPYDDLLTARLLLVLSQLGVDPDFDSLCAELRLYGTSFTKKIVARLKNGGAHEFVVVILQIYFSDGKLANLEKESAQQYAEICYLRAGSLAALKRYKEAEAGFFEVLNIAPNKKYVFLNILDLYKYQKKWGAVFDLCLKLESNGVEILGLENKKREIRELMADEE